MPVEVHHLERPPLAHAAVQGLAQRRHRPLAEHGQLHVGPEMVEGLDQRQRARARVDEPRVVGPRQEQQHAERQPGLRGGHRLRARQRAAHARAVGALEEVAPLVAEQLPGQPQQHRGRLGVGVALVDEHGDPPRHVARAPARGPPRLERLRLVGAAGQGVEQHAPPAREVRLDLRRALLEDAEGPVRVRLQVPGQVLRLDRPEGRDEVIDPRPVDAAPAPARRAVAHARLRGGAVEAVLLVLLRRDELEDQLRHRRRRDGIPLRRRVLRREAEGLDDRRDGGLDAVVVAEHDRDDLGGPEEQLQRRAIEAAQDREERIAGLRGLRFERPRDLALDPVGADGARGQVEDEAVRGLDGGAQVGDGVAEAKREDVFDRGDAAIGERLAEALDLVLVPARMRKEDPRCRFAHDPSRPPHWTRASGLASTRLWSGGAGASITVGERRSELIPLATYDRAASTR